MKRGAPASFFAVATHLELLDHALEKVLRLSPEVRIVSLSHHEKLAEYVSIIVVHAVEYDCILSYIPRKPLSDFWNGVQWIVILRQVLKNKVTQCPSEISACCPEMWKSEANFCGCGLVCTDGPQFMIER